MNKTVIEELILASTSRFRSQLLASTGFTFDVFNSNVQEDQIKGSTPKETAILRAQSKAKAWLPKDQKKRLIIGCDQTAEWEKQCMSKVKTSQEAIEVLSHLQGQTHTLHSAYSIIYSHQQTSKLLSTHCISIDMKMRALTPAEIKGYVATNEWKGCVGCYQVENIGGHLFIEDQAHEQSAIMGLPLKSLCQSLDELGLNPLLQPQSPWNLSNQLG